MISAAEISITFFLSFLVSLYFSNFKTTLMVLDLCLHFVCHLFYSSPQLLLSTQLRKLAMFHSKKNVILWPISAQAAQAPVVRLSSCEMSHGEFIRVWMEYLRLLLRIKKHNQFLNKNTSPYFHSASLVIWPLSPLTMLKRTHFNKLPFLGFVVNFYITL